MEEFMFSRIGRFFQSLFNALMGGAEEALPTSAKLDTEHSRMLSRLEEQKNNVALTMAEAYQARERLAKSVEESKQISQQAKEFIKQKRDDLAIRLVEKQEELEKEVEMFTTQYEQLRSAAKDAVLKYKKNEKEVRIAAKKIKSIKIQDHLNAINEHTQKSMSSFSLDSPVRNFKELEDQVSKKAKQLQAKAALEGEGVDDLEKDAEIQNALENQAIQQKLEALKAEIAHDEGAIDVESEIVDTSVNKAVKALEEPGFEEMFKVDNLQKETQPELIER